MGVFVEEEVISWCVFGDSARQVPCLRVVEMNQFNRLSLHIQSLGKVEVVIQCLNYFGALSGCGGALTSCM